MVNRQAFFQDSQVWAGFSILLLHLSAEHHDWPSWKHFWGQESDFLIPYLFVLPSSPFTIQHALWS